MTIHEPITLLSISPELIEQILCNLDLRSLLKCRQVCTQLKYRIDTCVEIQYIMELETNGLEANVYSNWASADCLESLRNYQSAWEDLHWKNEQQVPMRDGNLWELYGGVLASTSKDGVFHFVRLASSIRNISEHSWELRPDVEGIRDFGMDPSQDLLVWITMPTPTSSSLTLHLRTLNNAEKHPLARHDAIRYSQCNPNGDWHLSIKIMGDYIGLLARQDVELDNFLTNTDIFIWNWKEDKLELDVSTRYTASFAFISDTHIVLADRFYTPTFDQTEGYLTLIDFRAESSSKKSLLEVHNSVKLCYPPIIAEAVWLEFNVASEPAPGWTPGKGDHTPFFVAKENRVFTVSMRLATPENEYAYNHFIPLSTFEKFLDHFGSSIGQELKLWWEWAPSDTRLIRTVSPSSTVWVCFAHGSRSIVGGLSRIGQHIFFYTHVYDFNQLAIRKAKATNKETPENCERVDGLGRMPRNQVWATVIGTSLPYERRTKYLDVPPSPYSLMCTADHLVLVDVRKRLYRIYILDTERVEHQMAAVIL